jgi:hypothetical protein
LSRGLFSSFIENDAYKNAEKEWIIELDRYHKYWYDLVVHSGEVAEYFNTRKLIFEHLKDVKKSVEDSLEKRFIYFICAREKVRFNTKKKPRYNSFTKKMTINIVIGKNERRRNIKCKFFDTHTNKFFNPKIELTEKYITITDLRGNLTTASIHDFLESSNINLGICSKVEYVGYTKNPHERPTDGSHTGLSDVLYKVSNESFDTFIYFNVFKVTTRAISQNMMWHFVMPNAMTDEIGAELEGKLIEKCLIFYFDALSQNRNKDKELSELKNNLSKISRENNIKSIHFCYEFDEYNEYGVFSSSRVEPNIRHVFTVRKSGENVEINDGSEIFEQNFAEMV